MFGFMKRGLFKRMDKSDVSVAKNYLARDELDSLGRIVNAYLELTESFRSVFSRAILTALSNSWRVSRVGVATLRV